MSTYIENVPMKFHPRAFSAFGADLVTNDCVAIAELVKNSYDAFANNVEVTVSAEFLEIKDDGAGMTADVIRDAWAVIATPYKERKPIIQKGDKIRRVSGNKGLGRFSAARLGRCLKIITKSDSDQVITANIDWESFANSSSMSDCVIKLAVNDEESLFDLSTSGTIIKITELYETWNEHKVKELENSLSRLLSPFQSADDFSIVLNYESYASPVYIKPQSFIRHPTYSITGAVNETGVIHWDYKFAPKNLLTTEKSGDIPWENACNGFDAPHVFETEEIAPYIAGKFGFEIRAWDLDSDSIADVSKAFDIGKREIRSSIAQYKGLSIYRDNVLVLPKSDASKDWLGIDVRRVSSIGKRLSTSQIIGMVNISAENNPEIKDTTDREKLVDTPEYKQFCRIVETIISTLEDLRYSDKKPPEKAPKGLNDLISPLSAIPLVSKLEDEISKGNTPDQLIETVRDYAAENEKTLTELSERLTYYAQTASLGSVAVVILHEILTGMTVIKRFLRRIRNVFKEADAKTTEYLEDSETWHSRLVDVANSFAPLYRKSLAKEKNKCNISEEIEKSIRLISSKKDAEGISFSVTADKSLVAAVFAGELQTILVNLFDNAIFWIDYSKKEDKRILVKVQKSENNRARIIVSDSGVGITVDDINKIFQPGITAKPHGIGMGLVIVTELLNNYDCKIATIVPGEIGGATFEFEIPLEEV